MSQNVVPMSQNVVPNSDFSHEMNLYLFGIQLSVVRSPSVCTRPFGELLTGTGERHASGKSISWEEDAQVDSAALCARGLVGRCWRTCVTASVSTMGLTRLSSRPEVGSSFEGKGGREPP